MQERTFGVPGLLQQELLMRRSHRQERRIGDGEGHRRGGAPLQACWVQQGVALYRHEQPRGAVLPPHAVQVLKQKPRLRALPPPQPHPQQAPGARPHLLQQPGGPGDGVEEHTILCTSTVVCLAGIHPGEPNAPEGRFLHLLYLGLRPAAGDEQKCLNDLMARAFANKLVVCLLLYVSPAVLVFLSLYWVTFK